MRVHLKISTSKEIIPFKHQHLLVGTIHKWLGINKVHGEISLYSFSLLENGKAEKEGLLFKNNTSMFFSSYDISLIKSIVKGIQSDPYMFNGLNVEEVILQEDPDLSEREIFYLGSPIFIKTKDNDKIKFIYYDDPLASNYLKKTLQTKMKIAGIVDNTLDIYFDMHYPNAKIKKITYKGIDNKLSWCPVIVKGKSETKVFAWNVGLGNSTGIGFGAIK